MSIPFDLAGICKDCGGVIVWTDGSLYGVGKIGMDAQARGLQVERFPRSHIQQLPQGHAETCPRGVYMEQAFNDQQRSG